MSKCKILRGHDCPENAYLVNDYPYGFRLRCKIRYWLEKRHGRGVRLMSQTTNPKVAGEVWNKPKASVCSAGLGFMFLDEQGHVQWVSGNAFSLAGKEFVEFADRWSDQLNNEERSLLGLIEKLSRQINSDSWAQYEEEVAAAARNGELANAEQCDARFENHGSVWLFRPLTDAARDWLAEHCPSGGDHQYFGNALAVEARYAGDINALAVSGGLEVKSSSN